MGRGKGVYAYGYVFSMWKATEVAALRQGEEAPGLPMLGHQGCWQAEQSELLVEMRWVALHVGGEQVGVVGFELVIGAGDLGCVRYFAIPGIKRQGDPCFV